MGRIRLVPQNREFFALYKQASANTVDIASALCDLLSRFPEDQAEHIRRVKELEHEGDRLTHALIDQLNRTFVTPFDRDDMYRLAGALDDICDHVDEAADDIGLFGVVTVPEKAVAQGQVILRAATKLDEAIAKLKGFGDSSRQLFELRELEDEGDRLARDAVAELFNAGTDAITVIRWKEIHQQLEEAVDACENAADVLEAILVKNR